MVARAQRTLVEMESNVFDNAKNAFHILIHESTREAVCYAMNEIIAFGRKHV